MVGRVGKNKQVLASYFLMTDKHASYIVCVAILEERIFLPYVSVYPSI